MAVCGNCSMRLLTMFRAKFAQLGELHTGLRQAAVFPDPSFFNDKSR